MIRFNPLLYAVPLCLSGCAHAGGRVDPASLGVDVRNSAARPVQVQVCAAACSELRTVRANSHARFVVPAGRNTRAMVTAKRGDEVIAQRPVDFVPGDVVRLTLDVP